MICCKILILNQGNISHGLEIEARQSFYQKCLSLGMQIFMMDILKMIKVEKRYKDLKLKVL